MTFDIFIHLYKMSLLLSCVTPDNTDSSKQVTIKQEKNSSAIENPLDWEANLKLPHESSKTKIAKLLASESEGKADDLMTGTRHAEI